MKNYQNFLTKNLKDKNEYKTKCESKSTTNKYSFFLELNFLGVNKLFALVYLNWNNDLKMVPKGKGRNYYVIINGNNFYDQFIDCDVKKLEELRKLTTC